jgi:2-phosphosulfolactate phosphatase
MLNNSRILILSCYDFKKTFFEVFLHPMDIQILQLLEGARNAKGLTVIIDVFRAFTTACYAFSKNAACIIPVADIEEAYRIKKENNEYLLMGERNEMKPPGFDYGNSPFMLPAKGLEGKTIIHTTSSGTQGIVAATSAAEILTGSFVNAGAIATYIRSIQPETVSLVCMGYACEYPTDEDTQCAIYIRNLLTGTPSDFEEMKEIIRSGSGRRFFDPEKQSWSPEADYHLCLKPDIFNFVLKAEHHPEYTVLKKVMIPEKLLQNETVQL